MAAPRHDESRLKIGEVAERAGVTVRTLHHYDEIGLVPATERTRSGHRLYGPAALARLLQVVSLKTAGLSLGEIAEVLDDSGESLVEVLEGHLARLDRTLERQRKLRDRLASTVETLRRDGQASIDELTATLEAIAMFEKYYTPEQLEQLAERREQVGEERMRQVGEEWKELFAELRRRKEAGEAPDSEAVTALGRKAASLIEEFTGGDPGIRQSLRELYRGEGTRPMQQHGMPVDGELMAYLGKAQDAAKRGD